MEGLLALLLISGCSVGITAPVVSPIVLLILLVSATRRSRVAPFYRVALMTSLLLLTSYGLAFGAFDLSGEPTLYTIAGLCFMIMGIQLGFVLHARSTPATSWLAIIGRSLFWSFIIGYLVLGMIVLLLLPLRNFMPRSLFDALGVTMIFYPNGVFLVPTVAASLTKLGLAYH